MRRIRWGILGTGSIAARFAKALAVSETGVLAAVAGRDAARSATFAARFGAPRAFAGHDAAIADGGCDAFYIATPHMLHANLTIRAARAGRHVLCEKPLALDAAQAEAAVAAARATGVFLMEAFMYRTHPQTARLRTLLAEGRVGAVRMVEASFGLVAAGPRAAPGGRFFTPEAGGGAILDLGCYTASMARLVAEASGHPAPSVESLVAQAVMHPAGVDETSAAILRLSGGILAQLAASLRHQLANRLVVHGEEGRLSVASPWYAGGFDGGESRILLERANMPPQEIQIIEPRPLWTIEADAVGRAIRAGLTELPEMPLDDTLATMGVLDSWRAAVGSGHRPGAGRVPVETR